MTDIDWAGCPIVQRNPKKLGGIPTVRDFRVPADVVVENHDDGLPDDEIAYQFSLPLEDIRAILAYAERARQTQRIFLINSVPAGLRHHLSPNQVATAPNQRWERLGTAICSKR